MSRIYDALQKAGFEQRHSSESEAEQSAEPIGPVAIEEPVPIETDIIPEDIVHRPWKPSLASFPTLADRGEGVEQFRRLRSRMYTLRDEAPLKAILVCSGLPAEGKTFVAANLAISLARKSVKNILLIDGDLRRPTLHRLLGAPNSPGLTEYLAGTAGLLDILQRDSGSETARTTSADKLSNLTFIPAGKCGDNSSEMLANHRIEGLMKALSPYFDWIVIDSPPVLVVTDSVDLARAADAVLLVARGARTTFQVAQRAQAAFSNSRILGFVLNDVKDAPHIGYDYYYYHSDKHEAPLGAKQRVEK